VLARAVGGRKQAAGRSAVLVKEESGGSSSHLTFPISFEDDFDGACPMGWTCTGPAAVCRVGSSAGPCRPYPDIKRLDGKHFLDVGNDWGTATAISPIFALPKGSDRLCFKRSGGADAGSGLYLIRKTDGVTICAAENGQDMDRFAEQCCHNLARYAGQEVVINIVDAQSSGWGKVLIDHIRLLNKSGAELGSHAKAAPAHACGLVQEDIHYDGVHSLEDDTTLTPSAETCCAMCEEHPRCGAWAWGKVRDNWLTDKCFLKELIDGRPPTQVAWKGVVSGLPAKTMKKLRPAPMNASEVAEKDDAAFSPGSELRLYALGSSSMLWMNWIEELHLNLLRLGYKLPPIEAKVNPEYHPRDIQTCDDSMYFDQLKTARFARIGWGAAGSTPTRAGTTAITTAIARSGATG